MVLEDEPSQQSPSSGSVQAVKEKKPPRERQPIKYVSKHFAPEELLAEEQKSRKRKTKASSVKKAVQDKVILPSTPPETPAKSGPRIYYGLNVDELSSDSDLTDVPDDIPDPFATPQAGELVAIKTIRTPKKQRLATTSPYFPTPHRARPHFLSTLPFPPISRPTFGLMQERLASRPFDLLLATIFLNKTPGERAMPVCYELLSKYPTPADLAAAAVEDITAIIRHLGFQNQRARKIVGLAKGWTEREPVKGVKYRKLNYPEKGDGRDVKEDEVVFDDDERVAWEISHLPGLGPYSHDSWRMFCRDQLRGLSTGWNGEGGAEGFEPEWKRVLPKDKELRAWMTWMWMKEGWKWDCETGRRTKASDELMDLARGGGVVVEEHEGGKETLRLEQGFGSTQPPRKNRAERPAGVILDQIKAEAQNT
jgi:methyl-CpG-binding domain protein 4